MDWKSLTMNAFPDPKPFSTYSWPKLTKPGPGSASNYPDLKGPGPWEGGSFPDLQKPGPGAASSYPQLAPAAMGEGSSYPQLAQVQAGEGSSYPQLPQGGTSPGSAYPTSARKDHWGDWYFRVEIEGLEVGAFTKVEGLTVQVEAIEYQHSDDITPRKRMGRIKVDNVRLIKGYINTPDLYEWCEDAMKGDISRKSISVILTREHDKDQGSPTGRAEEAARYNLYECWPTKWTGFKLDAMGRGALVEEIELVVEEIKRG